MDCLNYKAQRLRKKKNLFRGREMLVLIKEGKWMHHRKRLLYLFNVPPYISYNSCT